jgi:hypothetical protein
VYFSWALRFSHAPSYIILFSWSPCITFGEVYNSWRPSPQTFIHCIVASFLTLFSNTFSQGYSRNVSDSVFPYVNFSLYSYFSRTVD